MLSSRVRGLAGRALIVAPLLGALAIGAAALAAPALATVEGGCALQATATSSGPTDLTVTRVWHLKSTDHVSVTATAPSMLARRMPCRLHDDVDDSPARSGHGDAFKGASHNRLRQGQP